MKPDPTQTNPLLENSDLPRFDAIRPEHVQPAVDAALADYRTRIDALIADAAPRTFANTMLPQEALEDRIEQIWSPVSHLHAVADSTALRAVYAKAEEAISDFAAELGQNRELYAAVKAVADGADFRALPRAARALVEHGLRDFRLSGVALEEPARTRFRDISNALTRLATEFEEAVLDATQAWTEKTDAAALAGLPQTDLELMREAAREAGHDGFLVT
ncbi:MAG TPA: oligopeptidase A, partial [Rudaea sp.]|nr:oligopeptidase A [Rudaea sp.]